ncbi:hypothetical protein BDP27DRAFT_1455150 [Rhodocollybia butyracea]|uniref:F-box domain-containing protein n=1 Tax=Rhodocollybia butyracea TaxID=206335 RepID=A0A9P5TW71_9AGAR|nr:hypothetical protein BDP27DRAFT_1455150 [Rhodocollybia butyracea]
MPFCSCGGNTFIPRVSVDFPGLNIKLRTESGPASVQPDEVETILQKVQRDIEDYEAEISRLKCLEQEKKHLEKYATHLQSLLSPARKVPDEILQHIFDDSCDTNSFRVVNLDAMVPADTSRALRSAPAMVISSVCARWRRIALSMPIIWSRISVHWLMNLGDDYNEEEHAKVFFPLSNFLDRSQMCPITVNFEIDGSAHPFLPSKLLHPFLQQLFAQMVRCHSLSFESIDYFIRDFLDSDFPGDEDITFPVLSRLCLHLDQDLDVLSRKLDYSQLSHLEFWPHNQDEIVTPPPLHNHH